MTGAEGWPGAMTAIGCNGATHVVRAHATELVLDGHPSEEAERAMAALTGDGLPPCVTVARAWRRMVVDGSALSVLGRSGAEEASLTAPSRHRMAHGPAEGVESELDLLLSLSTVLRRRLQGAAATTLAARMSAGDTSAATRLHAALWGRLFRTLSTILGLELLRLRRLDVHLGAGPGITGLSGVIDGSDVDVAIEVSPSWLTDVWSRAIEADSEGRIVAATDGRPTPLPGGAWALPCTVIDLRRRAGGLDGEAAHADVVAAPTLGYGI